jgi:hypothetical protein
VGGYVTGTGPRLERPLPEGVRVAYPPIRDLIPASAWRLRILLTERGSGSGPAYSRYFKQIVKAVLLTYATERVGLATPRRGGLSGNVLKCT